MDNYPQQPQRPQQPMQQQFGGQQPGQPQPPQNKKKSGFGKLAAVAAVAAIIGGGVGGGTVAVVGRMWPTTTTTKPTKSESRGTVVGVTDVNINDESDATQAFSKIKGAVVSITNLKKPQTRSSDSLFDDDDEDEDETAYSNTANKGLKPYSEGSGVAYEKKGKKVYIVTNNHVVEGADGLEVMLSDGTKIDGQIVGTDPMSDLAVVSADASKFKTVGSFANSSKLEAGQSVLAIGSPLGSQFATSVTRGIVSAPSRTLELQDRNGRVVGQTTVIQTDAAINSGNSGGPLVDMAGQIVGINSMKLSGRQGNSAIIEGMSFAIPSNVVVMIINQLANDGQVKRPSLGINLVSLTEISKSEQEEDLKIPSSVKTGVVITKLKDNSPAKKAGLTKYDVITKIDGTDIKTVADYYAALYKHKVGDTIKLTYYHQSKEKTVTFKLTETEKNN